MANSITGLYKTSPNFRHLSARCPHCSHEVVFVGQHEVGPVKASTYAGRPVINVTTTSCTGCNQIIVGVVTAGPDGARGSILWPIDGWPDRAPRALEATIRTTYDEARSVLPMSPQASAVLARRCLQEVLRVKLGIVCRTLFLEIQEALSRDELSKLTRDELDNVRTIGNWGAHPIEDGADPANTIILVTREEAEYTLSVLEDLFEDLYTRPQRALAMKSKITARE